MLLKVSPQFRAIRTGSLALLIALFVAATLPNAHAQRYRRYLPPSAAIALQPFSLDDSRPVSRRPVNLAYYAPRPAHITQPALSNDSDDDSSAQSSRIESNGSRPVVGGSRAVLRNGVAYAPSSAPANVKSAIWA